MKKIMIVLVCLLGACSSEVPPVTPEAQAQIRENGKVLDREMQYREQTRQLNAQSQERLFEQDASQNNASENNALDNNVLKSNTVADTDIPAAP